MRPFPMRNIRFLWEDDNQQDLELEELDLASNQSVDAHCLDPHFQLQVMQITAQRSMALFERRLSTVFLFSSSLRSPLNLVDLLIFTGN